jgi:sarcosine oxidase subunit alpha
MKNYDVVIVGGGPAGLCAGLKIAEKGLKTAIVDDSVRLGGQLIKQTHFFFGSKEHYAGIRGIEIAKNIFNSINENSLIDIYENTTAVGCFEDNTIMTVKNGKCLEFQYKALIVATGAHENYLVFTGNDLPGVYGAGAVQTLMNIDGVLPGNSVLMVGAGNIGLIVSYQMIQAGINVVAVIDASSKIGGYHVHSAKLRRMGVPILTRHTIKRAMGVKSVRGAEIIEVDEKFNQIPGTEKLLEVDTICLAVGLSPSTELLMQAGCKSAYIPELCGYVPVHSENLQTTIPNIFIAGDVTGIEEASAAMVEGRIAGLAACEYILNKEFSDEINDEQVQLSHLRSGPFGSKARSGKNKVYNFQEVSHV